MAFSYTETRKVIIRSYFLHIEPFDIMINLLISIRLYYHSFSTYFTYLENFKI